MSDTWIAALKDEDLPSIKLHLSDNPSLASYGDKRLDIIHDGQYEILPLRLAMEKNNQELARALLDAGADINALDPFSNALQAATTIEMVDFLVENGADVNGLGYETGNAVILASAFAQTEKLERLIVHGADVTKPATNDGRTALHVAASWAYKGCISAAVIRLLLKHGADTNARDKEDKTPLHWAADGNKDAIVLLLEHGALRTARDADGKTPFDYADDSDVLELLRVADDRDQD